MAAKAAAAAVKPARIGAMPVQGPIPVPRPFPPFPIPPLPGTYPDGTLLKASGPQVDMMQNHQRRWIPDPATFNYMGLDWNAIQTIPDAQWATIPAGPQFPSRADGTLLQGSQPNVYVMQNGQRHWIPDPATFSALGYSWSDIQVVADADLNVIPLGAQVPEGGKVVTPQFPISASRFDSLSGCGGHMNTNVTIFSDGLLNAVTRTWEDTDLRGFEGAVAVTVLDQNQNPLWVSATHKFGVDGKWIGTSDRTDNWSDNVPPEVLADIRYVAIVQQWNQNNVFDDISAWLAGLAQVAPYLSTIATAVSTIVALF